MKTAIKANGIGEVEIEFTDEYKNGGGYQRTVVLSKHEFEALKESLVLLSTSQSEEDEFEKWCLENGIVDVFQYGKPILRAAFEAGSKSGRTMKEMQVRLFILENNNAKLRNYYENFMAIAKSETAYLKSVIKSLLDNSDEMAKQRAMDAVKE